MIDPDHISVDVDRIPIPPGQWEGKDEADLVTGFHTMLLLVQQPLWDSPFTFVCLHDSHAVDRIAVHVDETYPPQYMEMAIGELVTFHRGKLLAVALNIEATSQRMEVGREDSTVVTFDSKYVITIPALGNILVSEMHRNVETKETENNGQWNVRLLEHATLDPSGELKAISRRLQSVIQSERQQRQ